jgi:hypothetical protein
MCDCLSHVCNCASAPVTMSLYYLSCCYLSLAAPDHGQAPVGARRPRAQLGAGAVGHRQTWRRQATRCAGDPGRRCVLLSSSASLLLLAHFFSVASTEKKLYHWARFFVWGQMMRREGNTITILLLVRWIALMYIALCTLPRLLLSASTPVHPVQPRVRV